MAITSLNGAIGGIQYPVDFVKSATPTLVAARPHSLFYLGGNPAATTAPSPGIGGAVLTTYAGQLPFTNPVSGNTYLARFQGQSTQTGTLLLCDRLWHNSGIDATSTSEQTFTSSAQIPARDSNGTNTGVGVYGAVEVSSVTGTGTPTLTLKYTSSDGVSGQTATNTVNTVNTSAAGVFYPIGLAAGDKGIQKAESIQLSVTWNTGTIHTVLYRVLARLEIRNEMIPFAIDAITAGFPRVYDNTVPFLVFIPTTTTASIIQGQVLWTQG